MPFIALFAIVAAIIGGIVYVSRPNTTPATPPSPVPASTDTIPSPNEVPTSTPTAVPVIREEVPTATQTPLSSAPVETPVEPPTPDSAVEAAITNTYRGSGVYLTPARGEHTVDVVVTVTNDVITDITTRYDGKESGFSNGHQERFDAAYKSQVLGKPLQNILLSRVGVASLTTNGFNDALRAAAAQAQ